MFWNSVFNFSVFVFYFVPVCFLSVVISSLHVGSICRVEIPENPVNSGSGKTALLRLLPRWPRLLPQIFSFFAVFSWSYCMHHNFVYVWWCAL